MECLGQINIEDTKVSDSSDSSIAGICFSRFQSLAEKYLKSKCEE